MEARRAKENIVPDKMEQCRQHREKELKMCSQQTVKTAQTVQTAQTAQTAQTQTECKKTVEKVFEKCVAEEIYKNRVRLLMQIAL